VSRQNTNKTKLPSISFVVARSYPDQVIGYRNALPWHLRTDLKRFREITSNHVIIMGRNTHESIGRTLPNRTNIVLTSSKDKSNKGNIDLYADTQLLFTNTREETLFYADVISICRQKNELFVVGGQQMYNLFADFVNVVHITEVHAKVHGDAFFTMKFPKDVWKLVDEISAPRKEGVDEYSYYYRIYNRRERSNRYTALAKYFTELETKQNWIKSNIDKVRRDLEKYAVENFELDFDE
jgi:dihydrofolate reductase